MATAVAMSLGSFILLILLQNTIAQQCVSNVSYKNTAGVPQQVYQKTNCASNQIAQNGLTYNPQHANAQQVYQQSNIQQAAYQNSLQPQINFQQGGSQQSANLVNTSPQPKQQNQDLSAIFSALYNIQQSSQNQRSNNVNGKLSQSNYEQQYTQNQQNPTVVVAAPMSKSQTSQPISNSFSESVNFQPVVTYQPVASNNAAAQPSQQVYTIPVHKVNENQSQRYSLPDPPVGNFGTNQQAATVQSQPIVLALQPSEVTSVPNQQLQSQPTIYTVQAQPTLETTQNQQISANQQQGMNNAQGMNSFPQAMNNLPMDKQSLMSYVMSQIQGPQGGNNPLASMLPGMAQGGGNPIASLLPAMLGSKPEKSSSMKTILPLILTLLNDRKGGYACPNCGFNQNQNNDLKMAEPVINTGYSNQINYSQQNPVEVFSKMTEQTNKSEKYTNKEIKENVTRDVINNSPENSEEEEDFESEEYDEE